MPLKIIFLSLVLLLFVKCEASEGKDSTMHVVDDTSAFVMAKSPWTAVLLSAVVPGAGQVYNHAYWKVPVAAGISGWFIYNYVQNNNDYSKYSKLYISSKDARMKTTRDFYHDQRDMFGVYLGLTYILTMVDAYVDAQLFDFSVDEKTSTNRITFKYFIR